MPDLTSPDYDWLFSRTRAGRQRGPQAARTLLGLLGSPERALNCIRVVGTNGKGSTCAMLEAGLLACGVRVGRFTSPHLHAYEERIRVGGQDLSPDRTAEFIKWAKIHAPDESFFDLTLALACQVFAEEGVDVAVIEAGVGGVSDATQALENMLALALTNADLDHTGVLGPSIQEIATDKASAARPGIPLLTTATGEALTTVQRVAAQIGAPLLTPASQPELFDLPRLPKLGGPHQLQNAALALATLRTLGYEKGTGAALDAQHPARLERFGVGGKTVIIDGAHNPHATRALAEAVPHADVLLFGNLARKDTAATLAPLLALAPVRIFTAPGDLATDPAQLAGLHGGQAVYEPALAFAAALAAAPVGGSVLVAGSLYLAGAVRQLLQEVAK